MKVREETVVLVTLANKNSLFSLKNAYKSIFFYKISQKNSFIKELITKKTDKKQKTNEKSKITVYLIYRRLQKD